jgi:hypothetical protein
MIGAKERAAVRGDRGAGRGRGAALATATVLALGVASCTGGDLEAEVGGTAIERDDDGGTAGVDDERGVTAEEEGLVDEEERADGGSERAHGDEERTDGEVTASDGAAARDDEADPATRPTPSPSPTGGSSPSPTTTRPAAGPTPSPTAAPTPARPAAQELAAGPAERRSEAIGLGDDGWVTVSSAGPIEPGVAPPPFRVDVDVQVEGAEPVGGAVCAVTLQASEDRALSAVGRVTVRLVTVDQDGVERRLTRQRLDLDVELAAGGTYRLPPSAPSTVDARELSMVTCEADFAPS